MLRIVHIGSAMAWAGGTLFIERFVQPTAGKLWAVGEPFMTAMLRREMAVYFQIVSGVTVVVGLVLYWIDSSDNPLGYLTGGGPGTVFGIGGIAGVLAFLVGGLGVAPNAMKLARASEAMATGGPTPELETQAAAARAGLHRASRVGLLLIGVAILCMTSARYV